MKKKKVNIFLSRAYMHTLNKPLPKLPAELKKFLLSNYYKEEHKPCAIQLGETFGTCCNLKSKILEPATRAFLNRLGCCESCACRLAQKLARSLPLSGTQTSVRVWVTWILLQAETTVCVGTHTPNFPLVH